MPRLWVKGSVCEGKSIWGWVIGASMLLFGESVKVNIGSYKVVAG